GGPGYGDPLERPLDLCKKDLNDGIYTERIMANVYGVIAHRDSQGRYTVDREASERRREELRQQRRARGVDFAEFYHRERQRLLNRDLPEVVQRMYAELAEVGPRWWQEFKAIWQLPEEFALSGEGASR